MNAAAPSDRSGVPPSPPQPRRAGRGILRGRASDLAGGLVRLIDLALIAAAAALAADSVPSSSAPTEPTLWLAAAFAALVTQDLLAATNAYRLLELARPRVQ